MALTNDQQDNIAKLIKFMRNRKIKVIFGFVLNEIEAFLFDEHERNINTQERSVDEIENLIKINKKIKMANIENIKNFELANLLSLESIFQESEIHFYVSDEKVGKYLMVLVANYKEYDYANNVEYEAPRMSNKYFVNIIELSKFNFYLSMLRPVDIAKSFEEFKVGSKREVI